MSGKPVRGRGELEGEILAILRSRDMPMSAAEVRAGFSDATPAYTTVLTALDRLVRKGMVRREASSPRKLRFCAVTSAVDDVTERMLKALDRTDDRNAVLMRFAGNLEPDDLATLQSAITRRRGTS